MSVEGAMHGYIMLCEGLFGANISGISWGNLISHHNNHTLMHSLLTKIDARMDEDMQSSTSADHTCDT